tara:strand:- start:489 stop:881 length:393 start_codon:yes stop_codon:yes gene_type:complete
MDPVTNMPSKEKISKMTICLDKSMGGTEIAEINFNMADFKMGEYKILRLYLHKSSSNTLIDIDEEQTYLDIGLKGTNAKGIMGRSGAKSSYGGSQSGYNSKSMGMGLSSSMMQGSSSTKAAVNSMENEIH